MAKRMIIKNIFDLVGIASEEESLEMLNAKEDTKEAGVALGAAKKEQAKGKRARDITALVTTGSEIPQRLEQLDLNDLHLLKIDELHAHVANADPQGSIPKPNKKIGLEKANLLINVHATLRRFLW